MNFLNELEVHLESFEGKAKAEIAQFIVYVRTKYSEPAAAVVPPPAPIAPNGELTIPSVVVEAAPVVEEPAPEVVEEQPIEATEEQAADQTLDVPVE
jgi:hypothetical protein